ncbi:hypothetical protein [Plastoroseomonas arctica]|uniref:Uncharacterized protein n=1 Tax=Plastoroseomonas arctica TaxID=1509237 RepID=A0AAF1JXG8_9PROT|nr:hypothetical protein [Plastoroseomonas arctica]MBR0656161.1 hypothetical protein [Plastoroseomonas arctica]
MIVATLFAIHDTSSQPLSPAPLHRAVCAALLPWLSAEGVLVLEGSVLRHQGRLRIFATMVERESHRVFHAFRFDGTADDAAWGRFAQALAESITGLGLPRPAASARPQGFATHAGTGC